MYNTEKCEFYSQSTDCCSSQFKHESLFCWCHLRIDRWKGDIINSSPQRCGNRAHICTYWFVSTNQFSDLPLTFESQERIHTPGGVRWDPVLCWKTILSKKVSVASGSEPSQCCLGFYSLHSVSDQQGRWHHILATQHWASLYLKMIKKILPIIFRSI